MSDAVTYGYQKNMMLQEFVQNAKALTGTGHEKSNMTWILNRKGDRGKLCQRNHHQGHVLTHFHVKTADILILPILQRVVTYILIFNRARMMIETQTTIVNNFMSVRIATAETIYIGARAISTPHLVLELELPTRNYLLKT